MGTYSEMIVVNVGDDIVFGNVVGMRVVGDANAKVANVLGQVGGVLLVHPVVGLAKFDFEDVVS